MGTYSKCALERDKQIMGKCVLSYVGNAVVKYIIKTFFFNMKCEVSENIVEVKIPLLLCLEKKEYFLYNHIKHIQSEP